MNQLEKTTGQTGPENNFLGTMFSSSPTSKLALFWSHSTLLTLTESQDGAACSLLSPSGLGLNIAVDPEIVRISL